MISFLIFAILHQYYSLFSLFLLKLPKSQNLLLKDTFESLLFVDTSLFLTICFCVFYSWSYKSNFLVLILFFSKSILIFFFLLFSSLLYSKFPNFLVLSIYLSWLTKEQSNSIALSISFFDCSFTLSWYLTLVLKLSSSRPPFLLSFI